MQKYVIALDQGTTSSRAVIFDQNARIVAMKSYEFEQIYPQPGWVEHDPAAILNSQIDALREAVRISEIPLEAIAMIPLRLFAFTCAQNGFMPSFRNPHSRRCGVFHCFQMHIRILTLSHLSISFISVFISHILK